MVMHCLQRESAACLDLTDITPRKQTWFAISHFAYFKSLWEMKNTIERASRLEQKKVLVLYIPWRGSGFIALWLSQAKPRGSTVIAEILSTAGKSLEPGDARSQIQLAKTILRVMGRIWHAEAISCVFFAGSRPSIRMVCQIKHFKVTM